jgi:hypothetical protein
VKQTRNMSARKRQSGEPKLQDNAIAKARSQGTSRGLFIQACITYMKIFRDKFVRISVWQSFPCQSSPERTYAEWECFDIVSFYPKESAKARTTSACHCLSCRGKRKQNLKTNRDDQNMSVALQQGKSARAESCHVASDPRSLFLLQCRLWR